MKKNIKKKPINKSKKTVSKKTTKKKSTTKKISKVLKNKKSFLKVSAFTLVEMMAVIVFIALLSVIAVSTYRGINESAKKKTLDAKIEEMKISAEKWARENNITSRTTISVNTLVVEGYLTADNATDDGLSSIINPVTGDNMICNTIDLIIENGQIKTIYNDNVKNCKLASQSLEDANIRLKVIDANGQDKTGKGSVSSWTNKDVILVVSSPTYDNKATSISYDFEGNTITKTKNVLQRYSGTTFLTKAAASNYYNVFYIDAAILLNSKIIVTYDIPGEGTKSRVFTIRIDQEEATAALKSNSEWIMAKDKAQITVDDGKGSGPAAIYISRDTDRAHAERKVASPTIKLENLEIGKYYIWTEDNAGNISHTYKIIMEINNIDETIPVCDVIFEGHKGGGHWYKEVPVTPHAENTEPAGVSGINIGVNTEQNNPVYTGYAAYNTKTNVTTAQRTTNTTRTGIPYYCHIKTLAGTYRQATQTLWLDMTPPTVSLDITTDTSYTRTKSATVTVTDNLSGIAASNSVRYGWAKAGETPGSWATASSSVTNAGDVFTTSMTVSGAGLTGIYYLHIDVSQIQDYAGNYATGINGQGTTAVFGPYMFDNTPPVCNGVGGKTTWTNGTYLLTQYCLDNNGTADQSGCAQIFFTKAYGNTDNYRTDTIVIRDKVGLETICPTNVYLEHIKPSCTLTEPGPDGENGWYKSASVTISATFKDNGSTQLQSGVNQKGTAKTPNSTNNQTSVTFTENGTSLTAYCYVKDVAGNENTNSLTFKKDDGSESIGGGCTHIGNSVWTKNGPISVFSKVNNKPISGCKTGGGIWNANCEASYTYNINGGTTRTTYCDSASTCYVWYTTGSGVQIQCDYQYDVYLDKSSPNATCTKSHTGYTDGVTFNVTCDEPTGSGIHGQSGCVSSGDDQGNHTGVTSTTTYTVKDNAGNTNTCTGTVTSQRQKRTASCSYGNRCEAAGCEQTYTVTYCIANKQSNCRNVSYDYYQSSSSGCPLVGGHYGIGGDNYGIEVCTGCSYYYRSIGTCGCASWNDYGDWSNVTTCTSGESSNHSTYTDCRTLYY